MEGYLGHGSKVKVIRSKNRFNGISMEWVLEIIDAFIDGDAKDCDKEYDCTDTTHGVFKVVLLSKAPSDLSLLPKYIIIRCRHEFVQWIADSTNAPTNRCNKIYYIPVSRYR